MPSYISSPNNSVVTLDRSALSDAQGTQWWIENGQVVESAGDGPVVDDGTSGVTAIAYVNGVIWQQAGPQAMWWAKTDTGYDGWGVGQAASPLPPSPDGTVIRASEMPTADSLVDSDGNIWTVSNGQVVEDGDVDTGTADVIELRTKAA